MKIAYKLIAGYGIVALLTAFVGLLGLAASKQIAKSFEGGEKHFRAIVAEATKISSDVKSAESHA
ncbi:MAG TPA: hypothetical protein VMW42_03610 [Desulfatiglandales bacterium]|nr:hypothetical protein [Desulfatiglandales bacterium]